jgi:hypothetical protein
MMLAVAVCLTFASCSDDEDNNTVGNSNSDLVGTYRLTSWNAPMAVDFDGDGVSNTNMMNESSCYNNSVMRVNKDNTYTMTYNYVGIDGEVSCETETTNGTWTRSGNSFTTSNMANGQNMNTNYAFGSTNQTTLTRNMSNWNYPSIDTDGNQAYASGNVTSIMTRD